MGLCPEGLIRTCPYLELDLFICICASVYQLKTLLWEEYGGMVGPWDGWGELIA